MAYFSRELRKSLYERKLAAGLAKVQLHENKIEEEVLKTSTNKSFNIGDKVRVLNGKLVGKIGSINYCNAGKCVVRVGDEQIFVDVQDLDFASEKPLDEATDDIQVNVDGEVIADTSTAEKERGEVVDESDDEYDLDAELDEPLDLNTLEDDEDLAGLEDEELEDTEEPEEEQVDALDGYGAKLAITDLLLDAINDENATIQKYNQLIAACMEEGFEEIANVVKHINEEENIHVGMLQYAMQTISQQAESIQTGTTEAEEIMNGEEPHDDIESEVTDNNIEEE